MHTVAHLHLTPDQQTLPSFARRPFKAVVIVEADVSPEWQATASEWLVAGGCLYMMAWGIGCSSWDDSVDYANLKAFDFREVPQDAFVMTTWHENDPLKEAFEFAHFTAMHPSTELDHTYLVHIAATARETQLIEAFWDARKI